MRLYAALGGPKNVAATALHDLAVLHNIKVSNRDQPYQMDIVTVLSEIFV